MNNLKKKIVYLNFIGIFLTFLASSYGQDSKTYPWDTINFPILSWLGPSADKVNDSVFQNMIDAGFTLNLSEKLDYSKQEETLPTIEENLKMLDVAEKVGLKLLILDSRINPNETLNSLGYKKLDSVITAYKEHKAFLGYFIQDEPSALLFDNIAKIKDYLNTKDPDHLVYVNLFPIYAYPSLLGTSNYEEYLSFYMSKVRPQILSFDFYCFYAGELRPSYFENLEIIRNSSLTNHVPFWAFTLSTQHYLYDMPTEGQISFQLYCNLAYGAKGLQYFTYGFIPNFSLMAPIDSAGNKTQIWTMARNINNGILKLGPILKTLKSVDVYHTVDLPKGTHGLPGNFHITSTDTVPVVIGYFKNKEDIPYMLLVNKKYDQNEHVKVSFSDSVNNIIEISKETGAELEPLMPDSCKTIKLDFKPGEGRLFRIQKKENIYLNIPLDTIYINAQTDNKATFSITTNTMWELQVDQDWLAITPDSGHNNSTISLTATTFSGILPRIAKITILGNRVNPKTVTVIQTFESTGIESRSEHPIVLYPLPINKKLFISFPVQNVSGDINIYTLNCRKLFTSSFKSNQIEIDMSNYVDGVYIINIILIKGEVFRRKIIKISNK
jgi:hypothetical protein